MKTKKEIREMKDYLNKIRKTKDSYELIQMRFPSSNSTDKKHCGKGMKMQFPAHNSRELSMILQWVLSEYDFYQLL